MSEGLASTHGRFATASEYRAAIDRLLAQARRRLCIFDRDLEGSGLDEPARAEALRRFFLAGRDNRVQLVLHDVGPFARSMPRLMTLLRQFSHAFHVHRTEPEAAGVYDGILIADATHYVHRFHFDHYRGDWGEHDLAAAQALQRRFDEIWAASTAGVNATTLGL